MYIYPTYTLGWRANSFSNDYLTQVKPISIHLLERVGVGVKDESVAFQLFF